MINFQFFPRSHGITPEIAKIMECFKRAEIDKGEVQINSNDMLAIVLPYLEQINFRVETGKAKDEKILP